MSLKTYPARNTPNDKKLIKRVLKKSLTRFTETCDRNGTSVRAAAMLLTYLGEDVAVITQGKREEVMDPSKVFQKKQVTMMNRTVDILLTETIYFEGNVILHLTFRKQHQNPIKGK